MASKQLTFEIFGKDKSASKTIDTVSKKAQRMGDGVKHAAGLMAGALAIAAGAAVAFGLDSIKAYADAEESQNKLKFALQKFPAGLTTNTKELGKLNSALAKKTRYDDDATASGQAVLAQFGLTGDQLKELTPLMQDYASSTGKDLPTAAGDLGKALLGQGRSLKQIGLDFDDTGSLAGNFTSVMQGLSTQVGGFAEKEGTTAAGKLEILRNRFGEIQEKIGEALMPAMDALGTLVETKLMPKMEGIGTWIADVGIPKFSEFASWVGDNGPLVSGLGIATGAMWGLNLAMSANPVGALMIGLAALGVVAVGISTNYMGMTGNIIGFLQSIYGFSFGVMTTIGTVFDQMANRAIDAINIVIDGVNGLLGLAGISKIGRIGHTNMGGFFAAGGAGVSGFLNAAQNGLAPDNRTGTVLGKTGKGIKAMGLADGGIIPARPGGVFANIGEGRYDEAVIPLNRANLSAIGGGGGGGGGEFVGNLYLDSGQLLGVIRGEIKAKDTRDALTSRMGKRAR